MTLFWSKLFYKCTVMSLFRLGTTHNPSVAPYLCFRTSVSFGTREYYKSKISHLVFFGYCKICFCVVVSSLGNGQIDVLAYRQTVVVLTPSEFLNVYELYNFGMKM